MVGTGTFRMLLSQGTSPVWRLILARLESVPIRLKEDSHLQLCFKGWARPFSRAGRAPSR